MFIIVLIIFLFFNSLFLKGQSDSLYTKPLEELYKLAVEAQQKNDTSYSQYYKAILAIGELPDCEAHLALAKNATQNKQYNLALYHLNSIIEDTITRYDLHSFRGRYKYFALKEAEHILLFLCDYFKASRYSQLILYFEKNQTIMECRVPAIDIKTKPEFALATSMSKANYPESINNLFSVIMRYPNNEIDINTASPPTSNLKFKLFGNDTMYYVRTDELLIERLQESYTLDEIDSALEQQVVIHIDTSKTNELKNKTDKTFWSMNYAIAYYTFLSIQVEIPFTRLDASKQEVYTALQVVPNKIYNDLHNTSFYKKIKGTSPRERISNIPCFQISKSK